MPHRTGVLTYNDALLRIARLPVDRATSLEEAFGWVTSLAAQVLSVERSSIWLYRPSRDGIVCADLFVGSSESHSTGAVLLAHDFPRYFAAVATARALVADDARQHPDTAEFRDVYLIPNGITSMLDSPIFHEGEMIGVVCHEHVGDPRTWTPDEVHFAASVADLASLIREEHEHRHAQASLRRQEEALRQSQKMEALGRLAGGVAHDFNNLLTAMMGYAQMIAGKVGSDPVVSGSVTKLLQVAEQAADMTRQLLAFSRNQEFQLSTVDINQIITGMDSLLRPLLRQGWGLVVELDPQAGSVRADPTQLVQVVLNLVINARDALPVGGNVVVSTRAVQSGGSGIALFGGLTELPAGEWVCVTVRDGGIGISDEVQRHLFEPFYTTKPKGKGTGLGLATVWGIIEQCHGAIAVDSVVGVGTTMRVYVRRAM